MFIPGIPLRLSRNTKLEYLFKKLSVLLERILEFITQSSDLSWMLCWWAHHGEGLNDQFLVIIK